MWEYRGQRRPPFAKTPAEGQESVWDYPRPPGFVADGRRVEVRLWDLVLAASTSSLRLLETASPPVFYLPREDVDWSHLGRTSGASSCEWKGLATYWALAASPSQEAVGWSYEEPPSSYAAIRGYMAFFPGMVECYVSDERVRPQPGRFHGGWITSEIVGPFKGGPGTEDW